MSLIINAEGIQLNSFDEIFDSYANGLRGIYGQDIILDQDTPDGQYVGLVANSILDLQAFAARLYNSFDPDFAEGQELNKILKLIARTRLPASRSTVDIQIVIASQVTLPNDYTVRDENGQNWVISSGRTLNQGTHTVSFLSENYGAVTALANTITEQVTIFVEVTSLTNPAAATVGRDEETDQELRTRRNKILSANAVSIAGGLLSKILALTGVEDAIVYENNSDQQDTTRDIAPHTLWVVVEGGTVSDIGRIIAIDKTGGTGLKGTTSTTYTETFVRGNGTTREHIHEVRFQRPTETNIHINVTLTKKVPTDTIDEQAVKDALVALNFNIAQNITVTELYAAIYSAGTNFIATGLEISSDGSTFVNTILESGFDEKFIIIDGQINITVP